MLIIIILLFCWGGGKTQLIILKLAVFVRPGGLMLSVCWCWQWWGLRTLRSQISDFSVWFSLGTRAMTSQHQCWINDCTEISINNTRKAKRHIEFHRNSKRSNSGFGNFTGLMFEEGLKTFYHCIFWWIKTIINCQQC